MHGTLCPHSPSPFVLTHADLLESKNTLLSPELSSQGVVLNESLLWWGWVLLFCSLQQQEPFVWLVSACFAPARRSQPLSSFMNKSVQSWQGWKHEGI